MSVRTEVVERDRGLCIICGRPGNSVHHIVKRGHAKICPMINSKYNLVVLCQKCHDKAHSQNQRCLAMQYLINIYGIDVYMNESEDFWRVIIRRGSEETRL